MSTDPQPLPQPTTSRSIRLRGVRVHNLKGIDLDLPLEPAGRPDRRRAGRARARWRSTPSTPRASAAISRPSRRTPASSSRSSTSPMPTGSTGFPPPSPLAQRRFAAVGPEHGRHGHRDPRRISPCCLPGLGEVICLRLRRAVVEPASPATVARAIDGLPERNALPDRLSRSTSAPTPTAPRWPTGLRADGFVRVQIGGQTYTLGDGGAIPWPESGSVDVVVDRLVRGSEPRGRVGSTRSKRRSPEGLGRCRLLADGSALDLLRRLAVRASAAATTSSPTRGCSATTARSARARPARGSAG